LPFAHALRYRLQCSAAIPLVWLSLGNAALAEIAARSQPGALVIDLQHGLWERGALEAAIGIAGAHVPMIARTADCSATAIGTALDAGACAVMAPLVETADDARAVVSAGRYPPQGRRSGGGVRPLLAGAQSMAAVNQHVALGAMIETALGARNADAICAVEGLDFIFIGTGDLQLSMPGATPDELKACCAGIRDAAHARGLPCGLFTTDAAGARAAFAEGYELAVAANDIGLAARGFAEAMREVKQTPDPNGLLDPGKLT
jgi:2-dehydro-3-deoxyglucarate aldolase/4-hydroxy-2-oxoheptanedioate aldolase